jgi:transcriptional regulator with XRE-family HTH domain
VIVDSYKLAHWMNVRKVTPDQLAETAELDEELLRNLLRESSPLADDEARHVAEALRVNASQLAASPKQGLAAVVSTPDDLRASRRPIQRDGITFYNYYSMAGAPGRVAPVILDILCPHDRLPALNNGHLEPAITLNLGPGDIHGRWGEELGEAEWQVLRANHAEDSWIVGDSYVEPSYCPHSYSLASPEPARIISYTCESNLAPLFSELNDWGDPAFAALLRDAGDAAPPDLLRSALSRRGFDVAAAAERSGVARDALEAFLDGETEALSIAALRALGDAVGLDYRTLLPTPRRHDAVGKTSRSIEESRASARAFRSYTVASMASAPHLPDLIGLFLLVEKPDERVPELDLCDSSESHYLVVHGEPTLAWREADGHVAEAALEPDSSAWVAPYVDHGFGGDGAVVKLGSGSHVGYLDLIELSSTFAPEATLRRGRRDALGWGYDTAEAVSAEPVG